MRILLVEDDPMIGEAIQAVQCFAFVLHDLRCNAFRFVVLPFGPVNKAQLVLFGCRSMFQLISLPRDLRLCQFARVSGRHPFPERHGARTGNQASKCSQKNRLVSRTAVKTSLRTA